MHNLCESFKSNFDRERMGRLWKKMNENILTENDLLSLAKCHNVSVYRKEHFKNYDTITFRCSQYRRFTKCQYQVKAKVFHDGIYQVLSSEHHEHESLENSIVPVEIRSIIRDLALNGLSVGQIRKTMEVLHPDISIGKKIQHIVEYEKKKNRADITFIDDLKEWCSNRASYPAPDKMHQVNRIELLGNLFICFFILLAICSIF